MNTPENIQSLKSNEIFVFGSNTLGRHGAGAAQAECAGTPSAFRRLTIPTEAADSP